MKIRWIGHSCFLITGSNGVKILTDPFDESVPYPFPQEPVDIVTVSHDHFDHAAVGRVQGNPEVVRGVGEHTAKGIAFRGIPSFHDTEGGRKRGRNTIFKFALDGITLAHCGDLGHVITAEQQRPLEDVQVILIPVGGFYTIGPKEAMETIRLLPNLRIVIPMHFKTEAVKDWPIEPVDEFLKVVDLPVKRLDVSEVEISPGDLPEKKEVWVLRYG
ncbi:MBL fold metallo-hydrolase [Candidatus Bipolaricaulota bacterium]|nr:MBL fold metallo-hydrolase [Candidatus Bipolaricaulota bacterium]